MRKLYVSTKSAWLASHHACHFHPIGGSYYIDLDGGDDLILVAAVFNGEAGEESFTANADVAALPDPTFEGTVALKDYLKEGKKYAQKHHDALAATLGVVDTDTVLEVSAKASARCRDVRIAAIY